MSDPTTLRNAADEVRKWAAECYPTDIFRKPTAEDFAEVNALLQRERGHQLDGIAAECYRRAFALIAARMDEWADDVEDET